MDAAGTSCQGMHCVVSGRVQGVCFRVGARQCALRLGLSGWVCNLDDGRVETRAYGSEAALQAYRRWLLEGPSGARVTDLDCKQCEPQTHQGFVIR